MVDTGRSAADVSASGQAVSTIDPLVIRHHTGLIIDRFILILDVTSGNRVVTAIAILSPWNKSPGRLKKDYLRKIDIDYRRLPDPPLDPEDAAWADELLKAAGKR